MRRAIYMRASHFVDRFKNRVHRHVHLLAAYAPSHENLHANERNVTESADTVVEGIPPHLIAEIHIAGGRLIDGVYLDSHDAPVSERTWSLLQALIARGGAAAITLERDAQLPNLRAVAHELQRARNLGFSATA